MTEEAGGASPRRGFRFQEIAAAFYFITDYPDFLPKKPEKLHIEQFDSDFAFKIESDDQTFEHFFEVKHVESGELKWGSKFKGSVFPEFYRIQQKHTSENPNDPAYFHLVTNGAAADRINKFVENTSYLQTGTNWEVFKARYNRNELSKLISGIQSNSQIENDEQVEATSNEDDLYPTVWGLEIHTPTQDELELKLEKYLRRCSPADFRRPMRIILSRISEMPSGVIHRRNLEEEAGISFEPSDGGTSPVQSKSSAEIESSVEEAGEERSKSSPGIAQIRQEREEIREFGRRVKNDPNTDTHAVTTATEVADELYEKLEDEAQQIAGTENQIGQQIDNLLEQAELTSTNPENYE